MRSAVLICVLAACTSSVLRREPPAASRVPATAAVAPPSEPAKADVAPPPSVVTGTVTLDGTPVTHYGVMLGDDPLTEVRATDGRFTLTTPAAGAYDILVAGPGFARQLIRGQQLVHGAVADLGEIAVSRGTAIRGRVVDQRGRPAANVTVRVEPAFHLARAGEPDLLSKLARGVFEVRTRRDGRYEIAGIGKLHPSNAFRVVAVARGRLASWYAHVPEHDASIDLVVRPVGRIVGRYTGPVGSNLIISRLPATRRTPEDTVQLDDDRFRIDDVPVGRYQLSVSADGKQIEKVVTVKRGAVARVTL